MQGTEASEHLRRKLAQPVRVAVTGSSASPGIYETLAALGKDRSVARIAAASEWIAARQD